MSRSRQRLEGVFSLAIADVSLIDERTPAAWKDNSQHYLPRSPEDHEKRSDRSHALFGKRRPSISGSEGNSVSHKALEFAMLIHRRQDSRPTRLGSRWTSSRPGGSAPGVQASRKHWPTPLPPRCLRSLRRLASLPAGSRPGPLCPPTRRRTAQETTPPFPRCMMLRRRRTPVGRQADVHGWCSTFKTWAEEQSSAPSRVIEVQSGRLLSSPMPPRPPICVATSAKADGPLLDCGGFWMTRRSMQRTRRQGC